jgi:hypothetical protein
MQYINIILDVGFKYLMLDLEIARQILSLILGLEILELQFLSQETVRTKKKGEEGKQLRLLRLDFKAAIKTPNGQRINVIIELQKDKKGTVSWRFRHYIAESYDYKPKNKKEAEEGPIPTIAVYLLGYPVFEKQYPFVRSRIQYENGLNNDLLPNLKIPNFVSGLSHECVYIHVNGFKNQPPHPITDLMLMFDQSRKDKKNGEILIAQKLPTPGSLPDLILQRMHNALNDKDLRRAARDEYYDELDKLMAEDEREKERIAKEAKLTKILKAKEAALAKERIAKEEAIKAKALAILEKEAQTNSIVFHLFSKGDSVAEIAATLHISEMLVEQILAKK